MKKIALYKFLVVIFFMAFSYTIQAQKIPLDPAVRTGKLPNGFTYFIRHNEEPKKMAELYLVNKVGSVLEDNDQRGLAHFMEHMNFNGTINYPKNSLVDYLQKIGVRFGADLNAYTSFDETIYQLPIPVSDPKIYENGLLIMRDWAQNATLDSAEIEKERGVVLEEERLGKGAEDRLSKQFLPVILNHARYAERLPIGLDSVLTTFSASTIKRFQHDWYRPDLQALIIVGDVNVDETERMIKKLFSDLKNPENERERPQYSVPLFHKDKFLALTDREATQTEISLMFLHNGGHVETEQNYLGEIKQGMLNQLLNQRRRNISVKDKDPAYLTRDASINSFIGGLKTLAVTASAKKNRLNEAFVQTWRMIEQVRRYGFLQAELDRVKIDYLASLDIAVKEKEKTTSLAYVTEYQNLFLHQAASPGIVWEAKFIKDQLANITLAQINEVFNEYLASLDKNIIITAPEDQKANLPDSVTVFTWIKAVTNEVIPPYKEETNKSPLLSTTPKPGKVVSTETIPELGITIYRLSNGVKVIMKPTAFKNDQIGFAGFSEGGTSLYSHNDFLVSANAANLIERMGYGSFNPVELSAKLTGKSVASSFSVTDRNQLISGYSTPQDLETALQLTYLKFTAPRKDSVLFHNSISRGLAYFENRSNDPGSVFADTIGYVLNNYSERGKPMTGERLQEISLGRTMEIYKERFADASGFTFIFVGNFTPKILKPLLEKYLGALPSLNKNEKAKNNVNYPAEGKIVKRVYKGKEDKATVRIFFNGDCTYSPQRSLEAQALSEILQIKITQHLREEASEVYSPQAQAELTKYPRGRFTLMVAFGCAPKNVEHLIAMVEKEMQTIIQNGPTAEDLQKFKAEQVKTIELNLKTNDFWLNYLLEQSVLSENMSAVLDLQQDIDKLDVQTLKRAAAVYFTARSQITFELLPESEKPTSK